MKDLIPIGVYSQRYLNPTMTFVYRQIKSVMDEFDPLVLTSNEINNLSIFPAGNIFSKEKNFLERLNRLFKKSQGRYALLSDSQKKYFKKLLVEHNAKLIHAHFGPSGIEILPVAQQLSIPLIVSFHGYDGSALLNNTRYLSDISQVFKNAQLIAVSNYMAEKLISAGANRDKIDIIYYGIDVNKFSFVNRKPIKEKVGNNELLTFLQVSNFSEKKGHKYTVEAFHKFSDEYKNCKLIFAGEGLLLEETKMIVQELGLKDKVVFIGKVNPEQVSNLMQEADAFLHHSITSASGDQEGIPNVIMEAMATGLPVISTYHSGIPELISDNVNGFLIEETNVPAYAEKLSCILAIDNSVGIEARNTIVTKFNVNIEAQNIKNLYKKLLHD